MQPTGILLVDKPGGWTSHDVVGKARRVLGTRKVGHAGTLDPMATGLLVLGVGSSTRLLTYLVGLDKEYEATIRLGASSNTDDAEGELLGRASAEAVSALTAEKVSRAVAALTGEISQVPSTVSAIKVDGKRAYARARAGEDVQLQARPVTVSAFDVLALAHTEDGWADVNVRVQCSSGTYIRALARDLGFMLGVGGHLTSLRRTRVGPFALDEAAGIESTGIAERLLPAASVAGRLFDTLQLSQEQAVDLGHGKRPAVGHADAEGPVAAIAPDGRLVGLVAVRDGAARVLANFPDEAQR